MLADEEFVHLEVLTNNGFADSRHLLVDCLWLLVDGPGNEGSGDLVAEFGGADSTRKDELDFSAADLLIKPHGGEDLLSLERIQVHPSWQPGALEYAFDAINFAFGQAEDLRRELRRRDLADGDGFPMQVFAVVRNGF